LIKVTQLFLVICLFLQGISPSAAEDNLRTASVVGCGVFRKELCAPALECFWCDDSPNSSSNGKGKGPNNNGGSCMEFDAWIDSCPTANLADVAVASS